MGMVGARELLPGEAPALHSLVERLSLKARVVKPRLYVMPDGPPRALSAGRGVSSSALAVSTSLLGLPAPAEIEAVVAHEIAHIRNRDVLVQTTAVVLAGSLVELSRVGGALQRALLYVLGPVAASFVHLLLSPRREFGADRGAAGALRVAARARRRARPARAGVGARRVPRLAGDRASLHDQPVRRGGPRADVRDAPAGRRARPAAARSRSGLAREAARRLSELEEHRFRDPSRKSGRCGRMPTRRKPAFSATRCDAALSGCVIS